ncbi:MAG: hypothetical protein LBG52_05740 [Candidatus Peribacteria bacterium]|jgi:hypothetical protein|nr:hypothetical protein [Candidatus Peribacteria bacterium]
MLRGSDEDGNDVKFDNEKYNDLRNEIEALKKVLEESEKSLTEKEVEDIKKERDTYFGLKDDAAKSRYDFQEEQKKADEEHQAKLDEETAKYNEQTEALDKKKRLIELINNMNGVSNEDVERIRDSETFQNLSTEDQDTLLNWLNKKAELEEENQEIIRMKQELYTAEQKMLLTNQAMIMRNLDDLDSKYQEIIARIHSAIAAQQEFNGLQSDPSGRGY